MKNRIPALLPGLLIAVSILAACGFPGATDAPAMETPTSVETIQTATYIPQVSETPSTKVWDHTQASCDVKSLYAWRQAGTFTWRFSYRDYEEVAIVTLPEAAYAVPDDDVCGWLSVGLGETMKDAPIEGARSQWSGSCQTTTGGSTKTIVQQIVSMVAGWEEKTTQLGTFHALRVKSLNQYVDGRTPGIAEVNDWYVCGYGRVYSESIDLDNDTKYVDELLSFTPQFTNEARVRYILADMQLINTPEPYRASITDEETAEAFRRWDAGIRVENIDQFERASIDGEWQIVDAGSGRPINGTDVRLTGDPQP